MPLTPDQHLSIAISATLSRRRYDPDIASVIAEIRDLAGTRSDILAETAGRWAGYYDDRYTHRLTTAILEQIEGTVDWAEQGRRRRDAPVHQATAELKHIGDKQRKSPRPTTSK